jgi:hypothetical protein
MTDGILLAITLDKKPSSSPAIEPIASQRSYELAANQWSTGRQKVCF